MASSAATPPPAINTRKGDELRSVLIDADVRRRRGRAHRRKSVAACGKTLLDGSRRRPPLRAPGVGYRARMEGSSVRTGTIRIVLADDHAVVRRGLELLLDAEKDFEVVASVGDVEAALRTTRGYKPDVVVLDLNMPGGSSLEAIPQILEASPGTQITVLTMQNEPAFARQALSAGARAYVLKEAADDELVTAVRRAAAGETYLNPQLGARMAAEPPQPPGPPDDLSEREVEVLRMIALGHTNAEIAEQLYLSIRTVESHRAHIQQKLRRSSRADLVRYALDHGLVEL